MAPITDEPQKSKQRFTTNEDFFGISQMIGIVQIFALDSILTMENNHRELLMTMTTAESRPLPVINHKLTILAG